MVDAMALYEKEATQVFLREGAVFRLQAGGLERTCKVEIGAVLCS